MLDAGSMRAALEDTVQPLIMVGHSHVPLWALTRRRAARARRTLPRDTEVDLSAGRVLLNPGSVGQPRDGDPRAAFVLLDLAAQRAWFRRVDYDVERTQEEIREEGLPEALAERLAHGV